MTPEIIRNYSLTDLNTFNLEVEAEYFLELSKPGDYKIVLENESLHKKPKLILGGGSNMLFTGDYEGLVIKNSISGIEVIKEDGNSVIIEVGAGIVWDDFVTYCVDNNYWGVENLSLIPGTVGAAPIQNIGAYGVELFDVFHSAKGFYLTDMEEKEFYRGDCEFAYRSSVFKKKMKNEFLITSVLFELKKNASPLLEYGNLKNAAASYGDRLSIKDISEIVKITRSKKLPDPKKYGNVGSFFKNPIVGISTLEDLKSKYDDVVWFDIDETSFKIPAAWLIEKAGWKGAKFGNVGTYSKQALVIINYGGATGSEILHYADMVKESVDEKFQILLEEEVNII
ncbi:MAG: UDP-N-acetylmuramate dehydrogenase [Bacteroidetes bacterium]|nr:UDP-N-acetylmuramate dehydrogenase [Bacteroidota bacterium]